MRRNYIMESHSDCQEMLLLKLIHEIPEPYREESWKTLIDLAAFLKFKAEQNMMPFLLCRSSMSDWFSPEEDNAWKYLEEGRTTGRGAEK
jgi:hypothetical protein